MNRLFRDFVTGTAFALILSKRQVSALLATAAREMGADPFFRDYTSTWTSLIMKGLIDHERRLTEEGKLVVALLISAGLEHDFHQLNVPKELHE